MEPAVERRCHLLVLLSLILLTIGIGYCVVFETCLADFLVVIVGLVVGWVAIIYCLANARWR
ncbi:hypothetical protein Halru_0773 [Halovivax ruber XH-70]|uniref:Uncharacterized protein n=1 Tax=Halovivax ruber (strain DSM 18193 / JCM 13892 / XH-70) TaxID=797302 RepID=L0I9L6_HALRX|nr:hypothetical protein [Halovivax ruber]AGB15399.1 hypothetical protein Halru_0773 [Halovivax ruber XH-70]